MDAAESPSSPASFAVNRLPWLIGLAGGLIYLLTLNPGVSLNNLTTVAHVAGWATLPDPGHPLTSLLFFPFKLLPETWAAPALNAFTSLCAAFVLGLLARAVALLPHNLTPDGPIPLQGPIAILSTGSAWIPPALAAVVCGLQLTFWERATSANGEMITLLLFAWVVRCLLEYRVSQNERWLWNSAVAVGAGIAEDWALLVYIPIFLAALVRLRGYGPTIERRFVIHMALRGLAGLSLCLIPAIAHGLGLRGGGGFVETLKGYTASQWIVTYSWHSPALRLVAISAVLQFALLSIRWKSHTVQSSDDSGLGVFLTKATGHFVHGLFLVIGLWMSLDPAFSPRNLGLATSMITYYFTNALVVGHCSGYFLLFRARDPQGITGRLATGAICLALFAMPALLLMRNVADLRMTNGPATRVFAEQLYEDLPAQDCVVLSENPIQIQLLKSALAGHHHDKDPILLDVPMLGSGPYAVRMAARYRDRWPDLRALTAGTAPKEPIQELVSAFAARGPVVFLHPALGRLFERFKARPQGLTQVLSERPNSAPAPVADEPRSRLAAINEQLWEQRWNRNLVALAGASGRAGGPGWARPLFERLDLGPMKNLTVRFLAAVYGKALNAWGVEQQQLGNWSQAKAWFSRALELDPGNVAARINARYNESRSRGEELQAEALALQADYGSLFNRRGAWREVLQEDGPIDEPAFLLRAGRGLLDNGNFRQAADAFERCSQLAPGWLAPKMWRVQGLVRARDFQSALGLADSIQPVIPPDDGARLSQLFECRTMALLGMQKTNEATAFAVEFSNQHGTHDEVLSAAADYYSKIGQFEPELNVLGTLVGRSPSRAELLSRKGMAELRLSKFSDSIESLTAALALAPADEDARLCRAIACMAADKLDDAQRDYERLLETKHSSQNALYGLASIAWRKKDTNSAIEYYEQYLSNNVAKSIQSDTASERLKLLKGQTAQN